MDFCTQRGKQSWRESDSGEEKGGGGDPTCRLASGSLPKKIVQLRVHQSERLNVPVVNSTPGFCLRYAAGESGFVLIRVGYVRFFADKRTGLNEFNTTGIFKLSDSDFIVFQIHILPPL